ncbi:hypothetical protein PMI15_03045 [Polaromonas sp. CF318]|nr:hypothetical protein PMI15_03045 [Polaromonas sp. CF318]
MGLGEIWLWVSLLLIALIVFCALLDDYREVRRYELAQREVRRRHDQCLADARERARQEEERRARQEEPSP